jgi:hypothetical protein
MGSTCSPTSDHENIASKGLWVIRTTVRTTEVGLEWMLVENCLSHWFMKKGELDVDKSVKRVVITDITDGCG